MTLVLKPIGRGNWHAATLEITGDRDKPLLVRVGERLEFLGITWRVAEVRP